jgi:hypothetical protein
MGREIAKLLRCPWVTVSAKIKITHSVIILMTSRDSSKGKYDYNNEKSGVTYLRIDDNQGSRWKTDMEATEELRKKHITLWVYTQKYSTIASGATTIGSAEHAPDDIIIQSFDLMTKSRHNIFEPILKKRLFRL